MEINIITVLKWVISIVEELRDKIYSYKDKPQEHLFDFIEKNCADVLTVLNKLVAFVI